MAAAVTRVKVRPTETKMAAIRFNGASYTEKVLSSVLMGPKSRCSSSYFPIMPL